MKKLVTILTLFIMIITCIVPLSAKTKVKVAYPIQDGLTEISENGVFSGYTYDYLKELERFTDFEFEFVTLEGDVNDQLVAALEKVKNGELDLMGAIIYDESLASIYDYTSTNYGMGNMALYVSANNANINETNIYSMKNLKVGVLSSSNKKNPSLDKFGETNGIVIEQVCYDSFEKMNQALEKGDVDSISVSEQSALKGNYRVVATYSPRPFYLATTKGNSHLISELNDAMTKLNKEQPTLMSELHDEYFSLRNNEFSLTDSEKAFIQENPVIEVAFLGGKAPFQSMNGQGDISGITVDVLDSIGKLAGIQFKYVYTESYDEYRKWVSEGDYMLLGGIASPYHSQEEKYTLSRSFLESSVELVLVKNIEATDIYNHTIALPKGISVTNDYEGKVKYFDNPLACLDAVESGKADYTYLNSHTAMFYNTSSKYDNINMIPQEKNYSQKTSIAIRNDVSSQLTNIINKGIDSVTALQIQDIVFKNATYVKEDLSLIDYIQENPVEFILFGLVLLELYLSLRYYTKLKNDKKIRREYERFQQISELSGDCFLEYNIAKDCLTLSGGGAFLLSSVLIYPDYLKNCYRESERIRSVLNTLQTFNEECYIEFLDGEKRWQNVLLQPIYDNQNQATHIIGKVTDIQAQKEEQLLWRELAQRDSLTKIYNSAACRDLINKFLEEEKNYKGRLAFIILDIDHFKSINDQYGHYFGDRVLQELAMTLSRVTKSTDILGRVGGDEFIIGLKYPESIEYVEVYCQRLLEVVSHHICKDKEIDVTVSLGVAFSRKANTFDDLYQFADQALYQVKKTGRNHYQLYNTLEKDEN